MREARSEEVGFVRDLGVYRYSTIEVAKGVTGRMPIGVRWVDTDKGDRYRSRLVAMEFRRKAVATIFAATPPLESLRACRLPHRQRAASQSSWARSCSDEVGGCEASPLPRAI